jgi:hypothetical protein
MTPKIYFITFYDIYKSPFLGNMGIRRCPFRFYITYFVDTDFVLLIIVTNPLDRYGYRKSKMDSKGTLILNRYKRRGIICDS